MGNKNIEEVMISSLSNPGFDDLSVGEEEKREKVESNEGKLKGKEESTDINEFKSFSVSYAAFLNKLRAPESAELIQDMRRFVDSFEDKVSTAAIERQKKRSDLKEGQLSNGDGSDQINDIESNSRQLMSAIHMYIEKIFAKINLHPLWKSATEVEQEGTELDALKESVETFIFAKCHGAIWLFLANDDSIDDDAMSERLANLQFITPEHLDIHCLTDMMNKDAEDLVENGTCSNKLVEERWMECFASPVQALREVERQYTPSKMLYSIHNVYRGVNEALSSAMVSANESEKTMPGADDVLPALILVVLCAQPRDIVTNLRFVELFAAPEHLRGEAGYAYTNLFSALQFLRDLNFEEGNGADTGDRVASLSITPKEFQIGLEKCRQDAETKASNNDTRGRSSPPSTASKSTCDGELALPIERNIPVHDIKTARLQGEDIDIIWARKWQDTQLQVSSSAGFISPGFVDKKQNKQAKTRTDVKVTQQPPPLPDGFSRSYTFLSTRPDDVCIRDVPHLLKEYQLLVHATESLLAERNARLAAEHKMHIKLTRTRLEASSRQVDEKVYLLEKQA